MSFISDSMQPPENHVSMMQIDCEVINTRLLHIHEDSIPIHLSQSMRAHASNASLQRNDSNEDSNGVHHQPYDNTTNQGYDHHRQRQFDKIRSPLYKKPSTDKRYMKPSLVQEHDFPRLPSSVSSTSKKYSRRVSSRTASSIRASSNP